MFLFKYQTIPVTVFLLINKQTKQDKKRCMTLFLRSPTARAPPPSRCVRPPNTGFGTTLTTRSLTSPRLSSPKNRHHPKSSLHGSRSSLPSPSLLLPVSFSPTSSIYTHVPSLHTPAQSHPVTQSSRLSVKELEASGCSSHPMARIWFHPRQMPMSSVNGVYRWATTVSLSSLFCV